MRHCSKNKSAVKVECPYCNIEFYDIYLRRHMRDQHDEGRML